MEIYKVVSLLKDKKGKELSISELEKETSVKIDAALLETLKQNESLKVGTRKSVTLDNEGSSGAEAPGELVFSYKRKYPFSNRTELLQYFKENPILLDDPELEHTYKNFDRDLERLIRERKVYRIMPSPKKKIYYYNSAPQYPRYSLEMIDVWDNAMEDTVRDMVGVRQALEMKYGVPLADLPFDEESFLFKQIQARRKREDARKKKKGRRRGGAAGDGKGGGKRRTNEALQDMKLEIVVGDKDNKIFVAAEDEDLSDIEEDEKERGQGGMLTPELPPEATAFAEQVLRAFFDEDCIVVFDALLKEDRTVTKIVNRRENELAERLNMPLKHLRSVLLRLKGSHLVTEKVFGMRNSEESNYIRHYSCWLISFNDFFDVVHYRLLAMEEKVKTEVRDDEKTLYYCPEKSCAKEYTIEDVPSLFSNDNKCLVCGGELISSGAEADGVKKWEGALDKLKALKTKLRAIVGVGRGRPVNTSATATRKLPSSTNRRGGARTTNKAGASASATTTTTAANTGNLYQPRKLATEGYGAPLLLTTGQQGEGTSPGGGGVNNMGDSFGEEDPHGAPPSEDVKIDFDNPHPIYIARTGKIYLPISVKTWRKIEGMKTNIVAVKEEGGVAKEHGRKGQHKKSHKRPHKKPKLEEGETKAGNGGASISQHGVVKVKKEKSEEKEEAPPVPGVSNGDGDVKMKEVKTERKHKKRKAEQPLQPSLPTMEASASGSGGAAIDERALKKARREERLKRKQEKEQKRQVRAEKRKRREERKKEKEVQAPPATAPIKEEKGKEKEMVKEEQEEKKLQQVGGGLTVETGGVWVWSYSTMEAHRFLLLVAELVCYYSQVLEFEITERSLYTARKYEGLEGGEIAACLERLSGKRVRQFPSNLVRLLRNASSSDTYFTAAEQEESEQEQQARKLRDYFTITIILKGSTYYLQSCNAAILKSVQPYSRGGTVEPMPDFKEDDPMYILELKADSTKDAAFMIATVKDYLFKRNIPVIEEFDYLSNRWSNETPTCENLVISLKEDAKTRDYQLRSAHSLFWDRKAHSAILVLPCGAGKTLVGITVSSIIKKCVLVFCASTMAVNQWREQFLKWTDCEKSQISRFTSATRKKNEWNYNCGVLITTYNMFASVSKRSEHSQRMIEKCRERTWGLMILDEVHLAPAQTFRRVTTEFRAHVKLGLTATMVREDELIDELPKLVGPRLFEVDLLSLKVYRHVAIVHCRQIVCPMTPQFKEAYSRCSSPEERRLIYITNPNKARICVSLLKAHLAQKHKCLVFCDDLFGLQWFSKVLKSDYIDGSTPQELREKWLYRFKNAKTGAFVLISRVGDHSIDLPEANVVIQVGVVDGSRMQEAQRLGRVQRKKAEDVEAYFYAIISDDTEEVSYSVRRKSFMEEHGYLYTMLNYKDYIQPDSLELVNESIQRDVLQAIKEEIRQNGVRTANRNTEYIVEDVTSGKGPKKKGSVRDRLTKKIKKQKITEEDV